MKKNAQIRKYIAMQIMALDKFDRVFSQQQKNVQEAMGSVVTVSFIDGESIPLTYTNEYDVTSNLEIVIYGHENFGGEDYLDEAEELILDTLSPDLDGLVTHFNYTGFSNDFGDTNSPVISKTINFTVRH